ncbi:MAG: sigma-70 family RNA polymerase sigma factor [Cryomorphaceae bacterium]|nr:sigma-70 family RNA polymerase sigma factor [Cryomorphaceae bacterium]
MYNAAFRILQSREEAEDVLQESFLKAFSSMSTFRGDASVGSWLKRIVVNASINSLKKRRLHFDTIDEDRLEIEDDGPYVETHEYTIDDVKRAVKELSDGYRTVFTLYVFEDYSHKEIGEALGISESTSKSQLNRARKRVAEWLITNGNEKG